MHQTHHHRNHQIRHESNADSYLTYATITSNSSNHLVPHNGSTFNHSSRVNLEHQQLSVHQQLPPMSTFVGNGTSMQHQPLLSNNHDFGELLPNSELENGSLDCTLVDQSLVDVLTSQLEEDFDPSSYLNDAQPMSHVGSESHDNVYYNDILSQETAPQLSHHDLSFPQTQTQSFGLPISQSSSVGDIFSVFGLPDSDGLTDSLLNNVNDQYCSSDQTVITSQQTMASNALIPISQHQLHATIQFPSNLTSNNVNVVSSNTHLQITPIVISRPTIQSQSFVPPSVQSNQILRPPPSEKHSQHSLDNSLSTYLSVTESQTKAVNENKDFISVLVQNGSSNIGFPSRNMSDNECNDLIEETKCFKCKLCDFICLEKNGVLNHINEKHKNPNILTSNGEINRDKVMIENTKKSSTYVCSKCYNSFVTLHACQQHMVNEHNLKVDHITLISRNIDNNNEKMTKIAPQKPIISKEVLSENNNLSLSKTSVKNVPKLRHILPIQNHEQSPTPVKKTPKQTLQNASKVNHNHNHNNSNNNTVNNVHNNNNNNNNNANHMTSKRMAWKKKIKREQGTYICEFKGCSVRFRALENLQCHHKCHSDSGSGFVCCNCNLKVEQWSSMAGHLWRNHGIDLELHACEHCTYRSYSLSVLENVHKRIHGEEKNFLCDTCGKGFKNSKQLINHKVKHVVKTEIVKLHECHICGRSFTDARTMKVHLSTVHNKTRPYICSICNHSAANRSALRNHMRLHTGEKPFQCDKCDYSTSDHNSLRRHKMRHSGERPYKCPFCNYACIQSSTYKQHLKNKHPGQNEGLMFTCEFCGFKTVNQELYHTHISEHNRIKNEQQESDQILCEDHQMVIDNKEEITSAIIIAPESPTLQFACIVGQSISSHDNNTLSS